MFNLDVEHDDFDVEEDEEAREAVDKTIKDGCPSQNCLGINEVDQR